MDQDAGGAGAPLDPANVLGAAAQLRQAREQRGLTLAQVAAQTRISVHQLERLENGEFAAVPGRIYAISFAKSFARAVGLDPNDMAEKVRRELGEDTEARFGSGFEPGDPARAPSGRLVWFSVFAVALLIIGLFFAARVMMDPAASIPLLTSQAEEEAAAAAAARQAAAAQAAAPADPAGEVVLTALGAVWLRISAEDGTRLMEGELAQGQTFTIPAGTAGPKLITARPDLLSVSIGGRDVGKLAQEMRTVSDLPIDAASILARPAATASAAASPASAAMPAPAATASRAPAARPSAAAVD